MAVSASRVMNVNGGSTLEQFKAIWRVRVSIVNDETNGAVHRKEPARMWATNPKYFGGKKMVRVRAYSDGSPNLCWFLEKQNPKHDGPLSHKAKRAQKKEMKKSTL